MDTISKKWNYNIYLGRELEWRRYYGEYCMLIDSIFNNAKESEVTVIARPLLFLIRHSLELGYKMNIIELGKISNLHEKVEYSCGKGHDLYSLHIEFESHFHILANKHLFPSIVIDQFNMLLHSINELKELYQNLDKGSYSFRYPKMTDGTTPSINNNPLIIMVDIKELYEKAKVLFNYTSDVVQECIEDNL